MSRCCLTGGLNMGLPSGSRRCRPSSSSMGVAGSSTMVVGPVYSTFPFFSFFAGFASWKKGAGSFADGAAGVSAGALAAGGCRRSRSRLCLLCPHHSRCCEQHPSPSKTTQPQHKSPIRHKDHHADPPQTKVRPEPGEFLRTCRRLIPRISAAESIRG